MRRAFCEVEDCLDPATRGTRCECHDKQRQRNGRVRQKGIGSGARHPTPWARVTEACLALADVDANPAADEEYRRARDRLRRAVRNYAASRGWLLVR